MENDYENNFRIDTNNLVDFIKYKTVDNILNIQQINEHNTKTLETNITVDNILNIKQINEHNTKTLETNITIFCKFYTGEELLLENININSTVYEIKEIISNMTAIPPDLLRIIFCGKQIEFNKLSYYGIKNKSILYIMRRLSGD